MFPRLKSLTVSVILLAVGVVGIIFDLTYIPAHGGYVTTVTTVRTVYETTVVWTSPVLRASGLAVLFAVCIIMFFGAFSAYTILSGRKQN